MEKQIAIVGISLRFPGAETIDQFWQNLMSGVDSAEHYDEEELIRHGVPRKGYESEQFVKASAKLEGIDQFDHNFFNYSPKDAALIDPQQRLLLECGYEALEDAGIPVGIKGRDVGVFAGAYVSNYLLKNLGPMVAQRSLSEDNVPYLYQCETDHLATNLAYRLNLTGPSISVQSWCTTAFSALYLASSAIANGDCNTALVGAANICVPQEGYFAPEGGLWSISGKTRSFDKAGDGCVSGSGVAAVILKDLDEAQKDRNQIYALLKGVTVNNDGKSSAKLGYHGATVEGQYQVISKTLDKAGISTDKVTYLEANGLATPLADRMELKALSKIFETTNHKSKPYLGSIKPNIGHLLSASGMAALIKSCLICKYKKIPPLINHTNLSKVNKRMVDPNFKINLEPVDLSTLTHPIICGMNSFGIGGSNAHAIIEEAPVTRPKTSHDALPVQLLTWSAKTRDALDQIEKDLQQHVTTKRNIDLADLSYSLNTGKGQMAYREMAVIRSIDEFISSNKNPIHPIEAKPASVWIFNGYGDTYPLEKFRDLYSHEPVFRSILEQFFAYAASHHNQDYQSLFFDNTNAVSSDIDKEIKNNIFTIVLNYAYGKLLMHWGIIPTKMVGISNGEYTAACLAGVFSFEEMIDIVIRQGEVISSLPQGKMLTVIAEKEKVIVILDRHQVDLGGSYLPNVQVVAGTRENCQSFCSDLKSNGIDYLPIDSSYAFHSREVDPILKEVESIYSSIQFNLPEIPLVSTVSGKEISHEIMEPNYWSRKMRDPVLFAEAMTQIDPEKAVFVEFGPGDKFSSVLKHLYNKPGVVSYPVISHQSTDAYSSVLALLGNLWKHGHDVDWQQFHAEKPGQLSPLPHYPFERQSFWLDYSNNKETLLQDLTTNQTSRQPFKNWFYAPSWKPLITPVKASGSEFFKVKTWMVFTNGDDYTETLIQWLRERGQQVVTATIGESFQVKGHDLTLNPYHKDGLQKAIDWLREKEFNPDHVLHYWCLGTSTRHTGYKVLAYSAMIELVRGIDKIKAGKAWTLFVATNELFKVYRKDLITPEKFLLIGPCRTIPNEFPNVSCQLIDQSTGLPYDELIALVSNDKSMVLAERHGMIYQQYLEPISTSQENKITSVFHKKGTYIITGGMGGIGKTICKYLLSKSSEIHVILLGRSSVEEVKKAESYLTLNALAEKSSNQVSYYQVDISERNQVLGWAGNLRDSNIKGVFHLAGIQGGGLISFNDRQGKEPVFDAKINGTANLIEVLQSHSPDFFITSSSSAALFGFFGLLDYTTANAYMDQLVLEQNDHSITRFVSVNWDMWAVEGMGTGTGLGMSVEKLRASNSAFAIDAEEGLQALEQILQWDLPQVAVLTRTPQEIADDSNLKQEALSDGSMDEKWLTDSTSNVNLETLIIRTWERIFERVDISPDDNFFQLGGHSLSGVMFINKMKIRFPKLQLSLNEIFDNPTPKIIARLIEERMNTSLTSDSKLKTQLLEIKSEDRVALVTEHLQKEISKATGLSFTRESTISSGQLPVVASHLHFNLKEELGLPIYAYEVNQKPEMANLSAYITREFEVFYGLSNDHSNGKPVNITAGSKVWNHQNAKKIRQSVFVCSAPRSGSTLLRLMLGGHSELFAPPELWLLGSQSMREWAENVPEHVIQHGGIKAILRNPGGMSEPEAHHQIQSYIEENASCFDVFREVRSMAKDKLFIDKTPNYYKDPHVFDRIEDGFEQARFIHLIRHPFATMDSIIKNRIYSLYHHHRNNPVKAAEHIWYTHNQHIQQFIERTGSERSLVIQFEDLVTRPEAIMNKVCAFLGVEFDPMMIKPYDTENMIIGDGDPNILNHDDIDPGLASAWQELSFQPKLDPATIELATQYQYPLSLETRSSDSRNAESDLIEVLNEEDLDDLLSQLA